MSLQKTLTILSIGTDDLYLILCSVDILLIRSFQVFPEDLASGRLGDLSDKLDPSGQVFVGGEGASNMTLHILLCQLFLSLDHICPGHLSGPCIGNSNHCNVGYTLQSSDVVPQLSWGDLQSL